MVDAQSVDLDSIVLTFRPLADWWANRIQWKEEDHEDLVQEGMLSFIQTINGYKKSGKLIEDLAGLAGTCFSAAMKWWYKPGDRSGLPGARGKGLATEQITTVSAFDVQVPDRGPQEQYEQLFVDEYLDEVERVLGPIAREVAANLIDPGPEVIALAVQEMEQKAARRAAGERVVGHSSLRTTQEHVRRNSNLSEAQWEKTVTGIRKLTKEHFQLERTPGRTRKATRVLPLSSGSITTGCTTPSPLPDSLQQEA